MKWNVIDANGSAVVSGYHEANASLIVRAVNNLNALVGGLEKAAEALADGIESEGDLEAEHSRVARALVAEINAILAKARKE